MNGTASKIEDFRKRYSLGRTTVYAEIKSGRLPIVKIGRATRITDDGEAQWLRNLDAAKSAPTEAAH